MRAQRYYLDRTQALKGSWSLLYISFFKGNISVIRPTSLSSWLNNYSILLQQADQQSLDWVQVKTHDRAFVASKALYGGVWSCHLVLFLETCHWKAHTRLPKRPCFVR